MDQGRQVLDTALAFLSSVLGVVLPLVGQTEAWMRGQMAVLGVPPGLQTAAVLAVVALMLLTVLRALSGLVRVALVAALIALVVQVLAPAERPTGPSLRHTGLQAPSAVSVADGPCHRCSPVPDGTA